MALKMRIQYLARTWWTHLESSCTSRHNYLMHGLNRTSVATSRQFSSATSCDQYVVKVAVVGDPNVGKSTLINQILDRRVNSVSKKVHTTRRKSRAVLNTDDTQIIFVDTPGFVSRHSQAKRMLEKSVLVDAYTSVEEVDVVVMVHDSSNFYRKYKHSGEAKKALEMVPAGVKAVLALNKVDLIKDKAELLNMSRILTKAPAVQNDGRKKKSMEDIFDQYERGRQINSGAMEQGNISSKITKKDNQREPEFDAVFMLSASDGTGVEALKNYLLNKAKPCDWVYGGEFYTDQSMDEMITMCVREKMLDRLPDEVPYMIKPEVVCVKEDESGILYIQVALRCQSNRQKSILRGVDDEMLTNIRVAAENSLSEAFGKTVILNTDVKETPEFRQRITKRLKQQS